MYFPAMDYGADANRTLELQAKVFTKMHVFYFCETKFCKRFYLDFSEIWRSWNHIFSGNIKRKEIQL